MDYKITLDSFEGPLDLLLNLIEKAKIDIYDIPINIITRQYMDHLYEMEELNLEITSEFILMASTLLQIKSRMLLPKNPTDDEKESEDDPREELVLRLLAYKKYKEASERLRQFEKRESKAFYKPREDLSDYEEELDMGPLDLKLIIKSINNIINKRGINEKIIDIHEIEKEEYTVRECTQIIVDRLEDYSSFSFTELLNEKSTKGEIVAYFLSVLELIKLKVIDVEQDENFSDLIIIKRNR